MIKVVAVLLFHLISLAAAGQESKTDSAKQGFATIDKSASFPGGMAKLYQYFKENLKYPRAAKKANVEGRVYVEFIVNPDGSVDDGSVKISPLEETARFGPVLIDEDCQKEAVRLMKACPNWNPAMQRDKPVPQKFAIPVIFKL